MSDLERPVVVGVDGTEANLAALLFAADVASRRQVPLRLAHVVPDRVVISPLVPVTPLDLTDTGSDVLRVAECEVRAAAPDVTVEARLRHGSRATQLLRSAADAGLLVVGRDDRPVLERMMRGDTAASVASRAGIPVVEVPADWQPGSAEQPPYGVVVVGLKSPAYADAVLAGAFAAADERGASLEVVHAWKLPSGYDEATGADPALSDWEREALDEVETLLRNWRTAYPDVAVVTRVVHQHPAEALVEASARADLLVVVRRVHGGPGTAHLGSVARAVLRAAACPVLVVPPTEAGTIPDLVLEEAGGLLA
ncbi:MAG: universal stress protein [Nocardioides sp.]|nr:universal stress protein [Nocardioidaceae bacterium]MCB8957954.1 universal stress protein [Nocardioides sp.]